MNLASNQLGLILQTDVRLVKTKLNVKHIGFKCPLLGHLHDQVWCLVFFAPLGSFLAHFCPGYTSTMALLYFGNMFL